MTSVDNIQLPHLCGHIETVADDADRPPSDPVQRHFDAVGGPEQPAGQPRHQSPGEEPGQTVPLPEGGVQLERRQQRVQAEKGQMDLHRVLSAGTAG